YGYNEVEYTTYHRYPHGHGDCLMPFEHQIMLSLRDASESKKIKDGELFGKSFVRLMKDLNMNDPERLLRGLRELYRRDLIIFSSIGTFWIKEDFKKRMRRQRIHWAGFVLDFDHVTLRHLIKP